MIFLYCTHCGFTGDPKAFTDEDEFWSCPNCSMDESGLEQLDRPLAGATVEVGVHWPEQDAEGEWVPSEDVTVEVGELLPYGAGVRFKRAVPFETDNSVGLDFYVSVLHNWDQVDYVKVLAEPLDITPREVQNT